MRPYPYHRYLTYRALNGDGVENIVEHLRALEYIPPLAEDVEEVIGRRRLVTRELRQRLGVAFFDDPGMESVYWLVETPVARTAAERLLLDRVHPKHVATVLALRFNEKISEAVIDKFRDGFWDTVALTPIDFSNYFRLAHRDKPEPPPEAVSLITRPAYAAWKQGLQPDEKELSPDTIIREIQVDAFMRFKQMSDRNDPHVAMEWAKLALRTAPARRALTAGKVGGPIPGLKPILEYPGHKTPTLGELHTEYSQAQSGTGVVSEAMGRREDDGNDQA